MVFIRDEAENIREGTKIFRDEVPVFENDKRKNGCNDSCTDCSFSADSLFPAVLLVQVLFLILLRVFSQFFLKIFLLVFLQILVLIPFQIFGKEVGDEAHGDKSEGHPFVVIDVNAV